jgi:hypothetical protein
MERIMIEINEKRLYIILGIFFLLLLYFMGVSCPSQKNIKQEIEPPIEILKVTFKFEKSLDVIYYVKKEEDIENYVFVAGCRIHDIYDRTIDVVGFKERIIEEITEEEIKCNKKYGE